MEVIEAGDARTTKNVSTFSVQLAELATASVVHPRDLGSNLSIDRKYFYSLCVACESNSEGC
jgi:hypothetical protein